MSLATRDKYGDLIRLGTRSFCTLFDFDCFSGDCPESVSCVSSLLDVRFSADFILGVLRFLLERKDSVKEVLRPV